MKNWNGIGVSDGLIVGRAVRMQKVQTKKLTSLEQVKESCIKRTAELYESTKEKMGEAQAEVFTAYQMLLLDPKLYKGVNQRLEQGRDLEQAIEEGFEDLAHVFDGMTNEYMRQRAEDIRGLKKMHLDMLNGKKTTFQDVGERNYILVAEEVTAIDFAMIDVEHLGGLVVRQGGRFSHAMIMARALNIPAVTGLKEIEEIHDGDELFVDGNTGEIAMIELRERGRIAPKDQHILAIWKKKFRKKVEREEVLKNLPTGKNVTADGTEIQLRVNINGPSDLKNLDLSALQGVGLYRTEYLFFERKEMPDIREQQEEYEKVFDLLDGKTLVVRTLDVGGDKRVPYLAANKEENPFLGVRGIRLTLKKPEVLETQMEALLRSARGRAFSIMFPMVDTVEEVQQAREIWKRVCSRVKADGCEVHPDIRLGITIETPAAAICVDQFVKEIDFVSIGSNDLAQYLMAADRENVELDHLLSPWQPAVMRVIQHVIQVCNEYGVEVSVCGEAGGEPEYLKHLIRNGLRIVSVSKSRVDMTRLAISETMIEL